MVGINGCVGSKYSEFYDESEGFLSINDVMINKSNISKITKERVPYQKVTVKYVIHKFIDPSDRVGFTFIAIFNKSKTTTIVYDVQREDI